jgi:hypothetical protein
MLIQELLESVDSNVRVEPSSAYTAQELEQIANLIAQGGEVNMSLVHNNLVRSPMIASASVNGQMVGAVVLKVPNAQYKQRVFNKAGVPEQERNYNLEVGYAFVDPAHRASGVSIRLLHAMRNRMPAQVFATTREQNTVINTILKFAGFRVTGQPYASDRGTYNLLLWTK